MITLGLGCLLDLGELLLSVNSFVAMLREIISGMCITKCFKYPCRKCLSKEKKKYSGQTSGRPLLNSLFSSKQNVCLS